MDGLRVEVSLSFQYMLNDNINEVVSLYNRDAFVSVAKDIVGDVFGNYQAMHLFSDKGRNIVLTVIELATDIQTQLTSVLIQEHATVVSLELLGIYLSDRMREALISTEYSNLDIQIAKNNQMAINTYLFGEKSKALITAGNFKQKADMLSKEYSSVCQSKSDKRKNLVQTIQSSLGNMRTTLGFSSKDFISYMYIRNMNRRENVVENLTPPKNLQCISDSSLNICK